MFKVIMMMKKKPELSRDEFIDYYDNRHLPFVLDLLSTVDVAVHRRNFVVHESGGEDVERSAVDDDRFDVITEVLYPSRDASLTALEAFADPEIRRKIQEDEDKFFLPGSLRRYVVEVHETVLKEASESNA